MMRDTESIRAKRGIRETYNILAAGVLALALMSLPAGAAEQRIDLDGNEANGDESRVVTRVLQSFPVKVENTVFNNSSGEFTFRWPGAGPGGFNSFVTLGPGVGTIWVWTTSQQVYSIESPVTFTAVRSVPVIGGGTGGGVFVPGDADTGVFVVPGKSLSPTQVTLSNASLTSSLITFFSPEQTVAACGASCVPGECIVSLQNLTGRPITVTAEQPGCCLEPQQIICEGECRSYLTDTSNCGGCGITCAEDEICSEGACVCPPGLTQCGTGCVDLATDTSHCGACGNACLTVQSCAGGSCLCPEGQTECGAACVDTLSDVDHCGGCDLACGEDQFCDGGTCACLAEGLSICDGVCVDLSSDDANCGACGTTCAFDEICTAGVCESICDEGLTLCGEECVDLTADPLHCGACGNTCGTNSICSAGACNACRPPTQTACGNRCVNIHTDPFNCGACGRVCDFSGCPSSGQGTCSQGESCVCRGSGGGGNLSKLRFPPKPADPATTGAASAPRRTSARRGAPVQDRGIAPVPVSTTAGVASAPSGGTSVISNVTSPRAPADLLEVVEAPVCDIAPIQQVIPAGGTYTQSQPGGRFGREIQTSASIALDGRTVARGPCPIIVPVTGADTSGVILSPVVVATRDTSGDGLCQPGEARCDYLISVANVGDTACQNPLATLSSPPDGFNPNAIVFLNATSPYASLPGYPGDGIPLTRSTNDTAFSITTLTDQAPDVGRVFSMSVNCQNLADPVVMPIVLGIGSRCNPETDLDGETYDQVNGLLSPVSAKLVPQGNPVNFSPGNFNRGSTIPMKVVLSCGARLLTGVDLPTKPQIVSLTHVTLGPQPLTGINGANNANPDSPAFACNEFHCEFQFRTQALPLGTFVLGIRMPDSRVYEAGFTVRP